MIAARSLFALFTVMTASATLSAVLQWGDWFWFSTALAAGFLLITTLGRFALRKTRHAWVANLLALLFGVIFTLRYAAPSDMKGGLIPTRAAFETLIEHLREAGDVIQYQPPPVRADIGITLVVMFAVLIVTALVDLLALEANAPTFAALPLLSLWTPTIALARDVSLVLAAASLLTWLGLLTLYPAKEGGFLPRAHRIIAGLGVGGVIFALVALIAIPSAQNWGVWQSISVGKNLRESGQITSGSPIVLPEGIVLSHMLGERSDSTVLRYRSAGTAPDVLRIKVMSEYSDGQWVSATDLSETLDYSPAPESDFRTDIRSLLEVEYTGLVEQFGVSPGNPVGVATDAQGWLLKEDTNELINEVGAITKPYSVVWQPGNFTSADLIDAPAPTDVDPRWLQLPDDLPASFYDELDAAKGDARGTYETALAIQDWFRKGGEYIYEVTNDEITGSALDDFFITRTGFCVHYATAMTLMLREEGIPARVAVGFLPGKRGMNGWTEVAADRAHAWPEVYFEGYGWIRFEPTPPDHTGAAPRWARASTGESATPSESTNSEPVETQQPTESPTQSQTPTTSTNTPDPQSTDEGQALPGWLAPVSGGALIILTLAIYLARARHLRRSLGTNPQQSWRKAREIITSINPALVDEFWSESRAPGQIAADIAPRLNPQVGQALANLASALDARAFAPQRRRSVRDRELVENLRHAAREKVR